MIVTPITYWMGAIICAVVLLVNVISVIKATVVINEVVRIDEKVKERTFFVRSLTVEAETLTAKAGSDGARAECKKVYEAIRYADPMSNDSLSFVESQISAKFSEFSGAVYADDLDKASALANEFVILVGDRNRKCMLLK